VGAFLLASSTLPFLWNVYKSSRGPRVMVDDPWGWGRSLEWATSCPPPRHNFVTIPRIRSESPAFDLHHPEIAALELMDNEEMREENDGFEDAPATEGRAGLLRENLDAQGKDIAEPNTDKRDLD
jgi:cytochrome c oxidase subunit 1